MIKWVTGHDGLVDSKPYMILYAVDDDNKCADYFGKKITYIVLDKTRRGNYSFIFRSSNNTLYTKTKSFNFAKVMKADIPEVTKQEIIRSQIVVAINEAMDTMSNLFHDESVPPTGLGGNRFINSDISIYAKNCYKWLKEQIKEGDRKNDNNSCILSV